MTEPTDLGIFPLDLVLLPGERIPLHLFEPRYRQLFADCVLGDRPFVIARSHDDALAQTGCTARFEELLQRSDDGRLGVIVAGEDVVELLEETDGAMYLSAVCGFPEDRPGRPDPALEDEVRDRYRRLAERMTGEGRTPPAGEGLPLSYAVAGTVEMADGIKQGLLESRDETERLGVVRAALDAALRAADRAEVAAERGRTNGRVSH